MDTSGERIKMCEKAKEIQKQWKPKEGDFVKWNEKIVCLVNYEGSLLVEVDVSCGRSTDYQDEPYFTYLMDEKNNCIWLPRQDQLQEMIKLEDFSAQISVAYFLSKTYEFATQFFIMATAGRREKIRWCPASMEQLWLAFVMKELYNKFWNGEDWINDKR